MDSECPHCGLVFRWSYEACPACNVEVCGTTQCWAGVLIEARFRVGGRHWEGFARSRNLGILEVERPAFTHHRHQYVSATADERDRFRCRLLHEYGVRRGALWIRGMWSGTLRRRWRNRCSLLVYQL